MDNIATGHTGLLCLLGSPVEHLPCKTRPAA